MNSASTQTSRADNKMRWLQHDVPPPSIGSLLSRSPLSHQRQTSSPPSQNREQVVPRCEKRRTWSQTAAVRCFLCWRSAALVSVEDIWTVLQFIYRDSVGCWLESCLSLASLGEGMKLAGILCPTKVIYFSCETVKKRLFYQSFICWFGGCEVESSSTDEAFCLEYISIWC